MSYDFADSTPLQVTVTLTEQTGPSTSVSTFGSASISGTGVQTVMVNSFSPVALAKVDAIKVDFAAPAGGDFRVDSISVTQVPEPASLGVMGVGALALLRRRR
ncbi:MAG: PEP-CTERM sorting domain-containing protein [Phycisphaerae bacterium]